jgi:hypothetical protein
MNEGVPDPVDPDGAAAGDQTGPQVGAEGPPGDGAISATTSAGETPTRIVDVPADVATDPPVDTETVEVPPVTVATVERPAGPRRVGGRVATVLGVFALLAIGAAVFYGYTKNQDFGNTRDELAAAESNLGTTRESLDDTTATLATTTKELADRTGEKDELVAEVRDLAAQVATQTECVTRQEAALTELIRISTLQTDNFNRTAEGSAWATAEKKRADNIEAALDAFYAAYSLAFEGNQGSARTQSDRGTSAQSNIAEAEAQLVAEVSLVNTKATEITSLLDDLELDLQRIEALCGETAP